MLNLVWFLPPKASSKLTAGHLCAYICRQPFYMPPVSVVLFSVPPPHFLFADSTEIALAFIDSTETATHRRQQQEGCNQKEISHLGNELQLRETTGTVSVHIGGHL